MTTPSRSYQLAQVDAFTRTQFAGNPAGVILDATGLREEEMQAIAREVNHPETAFIFPPVDPVNQLLVRYFTPTVEVPLCGHATIAAHYARARLFDQLGTVRQESGAGVISVTTQRESGDFRVTMRQQSPWFGPAFDGALQTALCDALGVGAEELRPDCPIQEVSTGHGKVIIGLRSRRTLRALRPDLAALVALSATVGCTGFFLFTTDQPDHGTLTSCRMFGPAMGIAEDPVTGNGNGPLGAFLVAHRLVPWASNKLTFWSSQGAEINRPGRVYVEVDIDAKGMPVTVAISGDAVLLYTTTITL